jgi:hypothetical protein
MSVELSSKYMKLVNKISPEVVVSFCIRVVIEWGSNSKLKVLIGIMLLPRAEEVGRQL